MGVATAKRRPVYTAYTCGRCGRKLKRERYVRSTFTGARFCLPGEGCQK